MRGTWWGEVSVAYLGLASLLRLCPMALRTCRSLVPRQEIWPSQFAGNTRKVFFTISSVPPPATRTQKLATTADMFRLGKYSQYTQGELLVWRKWRVGRLTILGRTASTTMMKRSSDWEIRWIDCCSCRGVTCLLSVMALFANLYNTPLSVPQLVWWRTIRSRSRTVNIRKSKLASIMFVILVR